MGYKKMKCLYLELTRRKKYLIAKLNNEMGNLADLWFQQEITDKEYVVRFKNLDKRIRELQG